MTNIQQIADIIIKLGVQGKEAFIIYMAFSTVTNLIVAVTGIILLICFFRGIRSIIQENSLKKEICRIMGWTDYEGAYIMSEREKSKVIELIKKYKDELK